MMSQSGLRVLDPEWENHNDGVWFAIPVYIIELTSDSIIRLLWLLCKVTYFAAINVGSNMVVQLCAPSFMSLIWNLHA